jgi:hypothetical protein
LFNSLWLWETLSLYCAKRLVQLLLSGLTQN